MCMYQDPSVVSKHHKIYPTVTNIDEVMRNLEKIQENAAIPTAGNILNTGASGYSREGAAQSSVAGGEPSASAMIESVATTPGAMGGSQYTGKYSPEYDYTQRSIPRPAAVLPSQANAAYTTQLGPAQGSRGKSIANAAAVYSNYSDAMQNTEMGLPNSNNPSAAHAYTTQYGSSRGSKGKAVSNAAGVYSNYSDALQNSSSDKCVPNSAVYPHSSSSTSGATLYVNRGASNNAGITHDFSTKPSSDYSRSSTYSKREQQVPSAYKQHVNLPEDDGMEDTNGSEPPKYTLPLNSDADIYTARDRQSKYENYSPVSDTNTTAAIVHVTPANKEQFVPECNPRNGKPMRDYSDALKPMRDYAPHGRASVNGSSSSSSSSSARDLSGIKHPPSQDDEDDMNMFGGIASRISGTS